MRRILLLAGSCLALFMVLFLASSSHGDDAKPCTQLCKRHSRDCVAELQEDLKMFARQEPLGQTWVVIDGDIFGAKPDELGPIGGAQGYSNIITDGDYRPKTLDELLDALQKAKPVLLEPIVDMEITIPAENIGDIAGDMASKRGRVIGQDMLAGNFIVVKAQVPLAEVTQYNSQLKSVTGGRGSYSMALSHYEAVPSNVQQQIVAAHKKEKESS